MAASIDVLRKSLPSWHARGVVRASCSTIFPKKDNERLMPAWEALRPKLYAVLDAYHLLPTEHDAEMAEDRLGLAPKKKRSE